MYLSDASQQTINTLGKCIYLHFDTLGLSMAIPPRAPLPIPTRDDFMEATFDTVTAFADQYALQFVAQVLHESGNVSVGIWFSVDHSNTPQVYIPIQPSPIIDGRVADTSWEPTMIPYSEEISYHQRHRTLRTLADVLQWVALILFARTPELLSTSPMDGFTINPNHYYQLISLDHRVQWDNPSIMQDGTLIVPSETIARQLIAYVQTQFKWRPDYIPIWAESKYIPSSILPMDDQPDTVLISSMDQLRKYSQDQVRNQSHAWYVNLPPKTTEPFFYGPMTLMNHTIRGTKVGMCLFQYMTSDGWEDSVMVSYVWATRHVNEGASLPNHEPATLSTEYGIHVYHVFQKTWETVREGTIPLLVAQYKIGHFAALLPIKTRDL